MSLMEKMYDLIGQQFEGISLKVLFLFAAVGVLAVYAGGVLYEKKNGRKVDKARKLGLILLVLYMSFLFQITFYRREPGSRFGIETSLSDIFFQWDAGQLMYRFLNIVLFVPFGAILTRVLKEIRGWKRIVLIMSCSYLTSLAIEFTQLLTGRGYFEAADLLMNVLGGGLGCVIGGALIKILKR